MKRLLLTILIFCINTACSFKQVYDYGAAVPAVTGLTPAHSFERNSRWVLSQDSSFYVALSVSEQGRENGIQSLASMPADSQVVMQIHNDVTDILAVQIGRRFPRVMRSQQSESLFAARQSALQNRIDFIIYPRLLVWEDTVGTWSEIAHVLRVRETSQASAAFGLDRARLHLTVMDSNSGRIIDVVSIDTRAGVLGLYEENPAHLLSSALGGYLDSLVP
jgi:hypothetical protein